jgi:hypothetical protein
VAQAFCQYLNTQQGIFNDQDLEYIKGTVTVIDAVAVELRT